MKTPDEMREEQHRQTVELTEAIESVIRTAHDATEFPIIGAPITALADHMGRILAMVSDETLRNTLRTEAFKIINASEEQSLANPQGEAIRTPTIKPH